MQDINEIMSRLDWNSCEKDKKIGIKLARKIKEIEYFIQPCNQKYNKNVWEGCARVISERKDRELEPYTEKLLEWLQDKNWPGYDIIFDRMSIMDARILIKGYSNCVQKAMKKKNYEWMSYLSGLLQNKELYNLLLPEQRKILKEYYNNYCNKTNL